MLRITYSEFVSVVLITQHDEHIHHDLSGSSVFFHVFSYKEGFSEQSFST